MVVHGRDGLDEVTTTDKTFISEASDGKFKDYEIAPEDFGFKRATLDDLIGGDVGDNAGIVMDILSGKPGFKRDIVLLNSGCAIYASNKAKTIAEGIEMAKESIDSGATLKKLGLLKEFA